MCVPGARGAEDPRTLAEIEFRLRASLRALPGPDAQALLAPRPRPGWRYPQSPSEARTAAALVLLYERDARPHIVLTVRSGVLSRHSGQVSFPGGAVEPDEAIASAALREASEEIGLDVSRVRVIGPLTPLHIPVSGFTVHPVVAALDGQPHFRLATGEVARVLEVPLGNLMDPRRLRLASRLHDGQRFEVPYFHLDGETVWGATAMMLSELLCSLGVPPRVEMAVRDEEPLK